MKTKQEIDKINLDKKAVYGKIYIGPGNTFYIGSREGALIRESPLEGDLNGTTLRNKIGNLGKYTVKEIENILDALSTVSTTSTESKTIQGTRNKKVTNSYLESGGVFMNLVPVITEKAYVLKSITMASETSNTWTVEIRDNGVLIPSASLTVTAGLNNEVSGLNIAIPIGSKLMFYVDGTLVQQPRVIITMIN